MRTLYSYVVQHDFGLSPNPSGGFCTLAFCKFSRDGVTPNIVELARVEDWIVGTGGKSTLSAGHGRLVYAMRVTEKLTLWDYFRDPRFRVRDGNVPEFAGETDMFALVSDHFFYFGRNAPRFEQRHLKHPIEKRGPGYRSRFSQEFSDDFVSWLEDTYEPGVHGLPSAEHPNARWAWGEDCQVRRPPRCRRKVGC